MKFVKKNLLLINVLFLIAGTFIITNSSNKQTLNKISKQRNELTAEQEIASLNEHIKLLEISNSKAMAVNQKLHSDLLTYKTLNSKYHDIGFVLYEDFQNKEFQLSNSLDRVLLDAATYKLIEALIPGNPMQGTDYRISSGFGHRFVKNHPNVSRNHKGLDFSAAVGTPIFAPASGVVTFVRPSSKKVGAGNFLRLRHGFSFESSYSHLSKFNVKSGQYVERGQLIAWSGNTGNTTGPHLHYEIKYNGKQIDPLPFVKLKDNIKSSGLDSLYKVKYVDWDSLINNIASISTDISIIYR
ncbi:peptidoglycan DD-metalloendopeptidase family protein [Aliivibrio fischeri]|nr:peptidoglycan DD-metalloendopeptidase family protein [Aliivibrio fischeri]